MLKFAFDIGSSRPLPRQLLYYFFDEEVIFSRGNSDVTIIAFKVPDDDDDG